MGVPQKLFEGTFAIPNGVNQAHDVADDDRRFVMLRLDEEGAHPHSQVNLLFIWFEVIRDLPVYRAN